MGTPLSALVRKDLQLFFNDRRSVILSFVVPIAIASFFGSIFSGTSTGERARIRVAIVDLDQSTTSKSIVAGAQADKNLNLQVTSETQARAVVKSGKTSVAVIVPAGFGAAAGRAFFNLAPQPLLVILYDPSHTTELAMVNGILTQHVMQVVSAQMFGGAEGRALITETLATRDTLAVSPAVRTMLRSVQGYQATVSNTNAATGPARGITMPYTVREEALTNSEAAYNGYAHSFGGMGVQFLLFAMANLGVEMLLERQRGLWKRLRSAPLSRATLLGSKIVSGTIISLVTLWVSFAFAMLVFGVRIGGSVAGFVGVSVACALMAATFGLLVAAIGGTPAAARAVTTLAVLMMVMLGGAWVPAFVFPAWLQKVTKVVPARWAIDGLDAMTWRGLGLNAALAPIAVLLGFAALFAAISFARFRWEEAP